MAHDYLAIPATSVFSERLFSLGGNMLTDKRCKLALKTLKASLCLKSWMQGSLKEKINF